MALEKFTWQNGTQIEPAKVEIGGQSYNVSDAQYEGETPLSAANLNLMQDILLANVKDDLTDDTKIPSVKAVKEVYSTTEKIIGTWINGKPIYRKVIQTTTGEEINTWTKIVNLQIDTLINKQDYWIAGSDRYPLDRSYNNEEMTTYWKSDGIYEIHNYSYANNRQATLIVEYTKTTD